jgi:hypothetical protein
VSWAYTDPHDIKLIDKAIIRFFIDFMLIISISLKIRKLIEL